MADNNPKPQNPGRDSENNPATEQHEIAFAIHSLKEKYEAAQTARTEHDKKTLWWNRVAGIGVGIYAALTIVIMIASIYSAKQAGLSAVAAQQTAGTAADTEQRQLRAYVGIVAPPDNLVANSFIPPNVPTIKLNPKNFGQTPAYNALPHSNMGLEPYPLPKDFSFQLPNVPAGSPITIFPGTLDLAGIYADATRALTPDELSSIQDGGKTRRLYVWGTITYNDAFGKSHYTNYCLNFFDASATQVQRQFCTDHNDSN